MGTIKKILIALATLAHLPCIAQDTLLENITIVDIERNRLLPGQFVLLQGATIGSITSKRPDVVATDTQTLNLANHYLVPGLFDMHVHLATDPSETDALPIVEKKLKILVKNGVTTVRDMAGDVRQLAYLARQANLGEIPSPDIYYSALIGGASFFDDPRTKVSSKGYDSGRAPWMRAVTPDSDFDLVVAEARGSGASGIKLYADITTDLAASVLKSANKLGFPVWGHAAVIPAMPQDLVSNNITSVSHAPLLAWATAKEKPTSGKQRYDTVELDVSLPAFQQLLGQMAVKRIYLEPTLTVFEKRRPKAFANGVMVTKAAFEAGVPLLVGTDLSADINRPTYVPVIDEMLLLHSQAGIPNNDVLMAATMHPARMLGIDREVGKVKPGFRANLLVLDANPLEDLNNLKQVTVVFKNGKRID